MVINSTILDKFGWNNGSRHRHFIENIEVEYSYLEKFGIILQDEEYFFIKKDVKEVEKYKFVNNGELFSLIIKNNAFNTDYQRHFKINKILK